MIFRFDAPDSRAAFGRFLDGHRAAGRRLVFTNGCFDLLHAGHVRYLAAARALGDLLVVGVNSDASVRANKGPSRPLQPEGDRAEALLALRAVDACAIFGDLTPAGIVEFVRPAVLAKGDEYREDQIIGAPFVRASGGEVARIPMSAGVSTSALVAKSAGGGEPSAAAARPRVVGVIPARYASTRLPGKPLADVAGKPLIERVYDACRPAKLDALVVATDDARIAEAVRGFGGRVAMTSPGCRSGSDRVMEVALSEPGDIFVNIQGDEPSIPAELLDRLVAFLVANPAFDLATAAYRTDDPAEFANPNAVKAVVGRDGRALYFSRAPVPHDRDGRFHGALKHIGIYLYRRKALMDFARLPAGALEERESLEQLRALESGMTIGVLEVDYRPVGVDTPEELERVRNLFSGR